MQRNPYVLVVTPHWDRGQVWMEALAEAGFSAFVCDNAREALCAPRPEVLVTELDLEDHDGLELCEALQSGSSPIATVLIAEQGSLHMYRRAMRMGINELADVNAPAADLVQAVQDAHAKRQPVFAMDFAADLPSTAPACEQVQRDLSAWLLKRGIAPATRCRVATALGEALENAREHAYEGDVGTIEIEAQLTGGDLEVSVRDRGDGCPDGALPNALNGELGSGFVRIAALCEDLSLASHPMLGTTVDMAFSVHRTRFTEEENTEFEDFDFLAPDHVRALLHGVQSSDSPETVRLSPAVAVTLGRLLAGPCAGALLTSA